MPERSQYTIETLDVALDVIEALQAAEGQPLSTSELSQQLNLNRSRIFRVLKTLETRGYVREDSPAQGRRLGLRFLELGECVRQHLDVYRLARPFLRELPNSRAILPVSWCSKATMLCTSIVSRATTSLRWRMPWVGHLLYMLAHLPRYC
jgi:DNA-binding IclR family transcriptional regulator